MRSSVASQGKIVRAIHANWILSSIGLLLSFCATVALVRALSPELFAQYAAVLAMISIATLVFEAGANSGLTRYLSEAARFNAGGSFYRAMLRRRCWIALALSGAFLWLGPVYARTTQFSDISEQRWLFVLMVLIIVAKLTRALAHYGQLALFETRAALTREQLFLVCRSVLLALVAIMGGTLWHLLAALLAVVAVETYIADRRFWSLVRDQRAPIPTGLVNNAQKFGLATVLDKFCAMLGSGTVLLLVFAPFHPVATLAFLALATELVGKLVSLTVMPMGNLVAPYLSQKSDDPAEQGKATARVLKLSSLLYCFTIGAGVLMIPTFVPLVYGADYAGASGIIIALLVPVAFENWVRGACSPVLLRNGRFRQLAQINIAQAALTLGTIFLVHRAPLLHAVAAVVSVRAVVSACNLLLLRGIMDPGSLRVPALGAAVAAIAASISWLLIAPAAFPALLELALEGALFAAIFYAGIRGVVLRDPDILEIAHRLAGRRGSWLLPPLPC